MQMVFVKRQVTDMMRHAKVQYVERNFDPNLPQRVFWSNFLFLGLCDSSDFLLPIQVPPASDVVGNFFLGILILMSVSPRLGISRPAVGADDISIKFLKLLLPFICCNVMHVFNQAITSPVFPSIWNVVIIRPVAKVGTLGGPSEFHPISVVSILSKAFERILHDQLLVHVNNRSLLSDFKSGLRRRHNTTFHMINNLLFLHKLGSEYDFHTSARDGFFVSSRSFYSGCG
jgi:hypothetical protein